MEYEPKNEGFEEPSLSIKSVGKFLREYGMLIALCAALILVAIVGGVERLAPQQTTEYLPSILELS